MVENAKGSRLVLYTKILRNYFTLWVFLGPTIFAIFQFKLSDQKSFLEPFWLWQRGRCLQPVSLAHFNCRLPRRHHSQLPWAILPFMRWSLFRHLQSTWKFDWRVVRFTWQRTRCFIEGRSILAHHKALRGSQFQPTSSFLLLLFKIVQRLRSFGVSWRWWLSSFSMWIFYIFSHLFNVLKFMAEEAVAVSLLHFLIFHGISTRVAMSRKIWILSTFAK